MKRPKDRRSNVARWRSIPRGSSISGSRSSTHTPAKSAPGPGLSTTRSYRRRPAACSSCSTRSEERRVGKECRSLCDWSSDVCSSDLFQVINPHSREKRAGTGPIYYEVVPEETCGVLKLLYAPLPNAADKGKVEPADALVKLMKSIEKLLTTYGISAKRTTGWGTAEIECWKAKLCNGKAVKENDLKNFIEQLKGSLTASGAHRE